MPHAAKQTQGRTRDTGAITVIHNLTNLNVLAIMAGTLMPLLYHKHSPASIRKIAAADNRNAYRWASRIAKLKNG